MRRIERLINLIAALLETDRPMTAEDIHQSIAGYGDTPSSDAFRRAFERDKQALRAMGIPLELRATDPFSDQLDGYIIPKAKYYLPRLDLEPDEAAALLIAADAILGPGEDVASGVMKVTMDADVSSIGPRVVWSADLSAQQPLLGEIYAALLDRTPIGFGYEPAAGDTTERVVEPYGLVHRRGHWYLVGRDRMREDVRSFKLSRIRGEVSEIDGTYEVPAGFDPAERVREAWEVGADEPATAIVRFDADIRWWPEQNMPDAPRKELPDEEVEVEIEVSNLDALVSWALGFGPKVEIVAPDSARRRLVEHLAPLVETA